MARFGNKLPDRVLNKPELRIGLDVFIDAFYDLDTERSLTDLQPIPNSQIRNYAAYYGYSVNSTEDLIHYIRQMDNAYLRMLTNKRKIKK